MLAMAAAPGAPPGGRMKVLVTGATGFVGSHAVAALARAGHQVRVLARRPARVAPALGPVGSPRVEVAEGEVGDAPAVAQAIRGCQAVLHAANVYSLDPRRGREMARTNVEGTEVVLRLAAEAGCDPVVHVSTVLVLYPATGAAGRDLPLGSDIGSPYLSTKMAAERIARRFQERGLPVVTTYPGGVFGPNDPGPGEMVRLLSGFLGNRYCIDLARGGLPLADVRWIAAAHAALFASGLGPRRVTMSGRYLAWREIFELLRRLTGRRLPTFPTPAAAATAVAGLADVLQRVVPWRLPLGRESMWAVLNSSPVEDAEAVALAGQPPPAEETLADAIRWAVGAGHLPAARAGALLAASPSAAG